MIGLIACPRLGAGSGPRVTFFAYNRVRELGWASRDEMWGLMSHEPVIISKARTSVRRLLLLCAVAFCGFFAYGAMSGGKPVALGIWTGIVFGLPAGIVGWLLLGIIRFAFGSAPR